MTLKWTFALINVRKPRSEEEDWLEQLTLSLDTTIQELEMEESYRIPWCGRRRWNSTFKKIRREYYRRVRLVLKSELNAANRFETIDFLAVSVVTSDLTS